jgi:hypothetical protein
VRNLIILVLAGLCAWLVKERITLKEEVGSLSQQLEKIQKEHTEFQMQVGVAPNQRPGTGAPRIGGRPAPGSSQWIQEHVERGARALEAPKR